MKTLVVVLSLGAVVAAIVQSRSCNCCCSGYHFCYCCFMFADVVDAIAAAAVVPNETDFT